MNICKRCGVEYDLFMVSKKYIDRNPERYENCTNCRKYKNCEYCKVEFHHKQNKTCSMSCANKLKELSFMNSCGTKHNFSRESSSRKKWENRIQEEEGIKNVFQRQDVKDKLKITIKEKYGVDNISQNAEIKIKIREKFNDIMKNNPLHFKEIWHKNHKKFVDELGYDPRLHVFGKASKSSLKVFNKLIDWCLEKGINYDDIYIGIDDKNEYFIKGEDNIFMYDFTIRSKKIIIEYHGVFFHAKKKDKNWISIFTNESAEENIRKRNIKNNLAKSKGFRLLEIWEDDEFDINLEKCKKFIEKNL